MARREAEGHRSSGDGTASPAQLLATVIVLAALIWFAVVPLAKKVGTTSGSATSRRTSGVDDTAGYGSARIGQETTIARTCLAGTSEDDYDRILQLTLAKDTEGIALMRLAGRAVILDAGTRCRVIESGFLTYEVRVLDGPHNLKAVVTASENVSRMLNTSWLRDAHYGDETPAVTQRRPTTREATIPSDVSYSIISWSTRSDFKRSLDVRLNKRVSQQTLRAIALKLKDQDSKEYDNTFILYYLPGMAVGSGAWATTHFNPTLKVKILGLTADEHTRLVEQPVPPGRKIIGSWLDETPMVGRRITIYEAGGKLFLEWTVGDGGTIKHDIVEKRSPLGRRFDKVGGSSFGDHWVLGADGDLQIRDDDGLITTAKSIR
ncbi:MAG: hypothetical protein V2A76_12995 [Planctomycetota bacterium]